MGSDRATALNKELKNIYDNRKPENAQNMDAMLWGKIKKSSKKPNGNGFFGGFIASGNQAGLGAQNELEALRTPDTQQTEQYQVTPKVITNTIQLSGLYLEVSKGNEASFADGLTLQLDEGLMDFEKELNQQLFRQGSGVIARVNGAVSASTSVIFDTGIPSHFRYDEPLDIYDSAGIGASVGVKQVSGVKIADIDIANKTLTLASAVTCDDNGYIFRQSTGDNTTNGKELDGLPAITDDGTDSSTYENVTRTGSGYVPAFKGIEIAAVSANLSDDLLRRLASRGQVLAGKKYNMVVSSTSQFRKYMSVTLPQVQFTRSGAEAAQRDSGVVGMPVWDGKEWLVDTDCGDDEVYLIGLDYIEKYEVYAPKFDDTDGNILKQRDGYDSFIAYAKYYGNIGTRHPRAAAARLTGLAEATF
jgi:hypothetical protein